MTKKYFVQHLFAGQKLDHHSTAYLQGFSVSKRLALEVPVASISENVSFSMGTLFAAE